MQQHHPPPPHDDQGRRPTTTPTTQPTTNAQPNYDPNYRNNPESTGEEDLNFQPEPFHRNLENSGMADNGRSSGQSSPERPSQYDTDDLLDEEADDLLPDDEDVDDMDMEEENVEETEEGTRPNRPQRPDIYADENSRNKHTDQNRHTEGGQGPEGNTPIF